MSTSPFIDRESGAIDTEQILAEALPLAKLIGLFVAIALVPLAGLVLLGPASGISIIFAILAQFILAIGAGLTLMYVISRAVDIAEA